MKKTQVFRGIVIQIHRVYSDYFIQIGQRVLLDDIFWSRDIYGKYPLYNRQ